MTRSTRPRRSMGAVAGCLLIAATVAACGSDAKKTTGTTTTSAAATSTTKPAATTSTASGAATSTSTDGTEPTGTDAGATTTTAPAVPVYPLTGLPIDNEATAVRPALVVKIDNHPQARPQTGLNQADIVFEENVELLTRFAAVFQSQDSDPVGPIRSGRTQDVMLLGSFNKPLFAWSGGNPNVTKAIASSDLVDLNWQKIGDKGGYKRDNSRPAPHNLYSKTTTLYSFTPLYAPAPPQQFTYRTEGEAFNGAPAKGADVAMDGNVNVNWTWDAGSTSYVRSQNGKPHQLSDGTTVNAANVVFLEVDYQPSPADARSPEAQTIGTGKVTVLTGGAMIQGTWSRDDRLKPFTLTDGSGNTIALTPGRTWVELARAGTVKVNT